jgi:hypothetical protein
VIKKLFALVFLLIPIVSFAAEPIKQNTQTVVILGPFVDDTDGKTPVTDLVIANTDIRLNKHNSSTDVDKESGGATHVENGYYYTTLSANDTDTLGRLRVMVSVSGALPVWELYEVMGANAYDTYYGTKPFVMGIGSISVNHDYGGTDELAYVTSGGIGIQNAIIKVYLKTDYDANHRSELYVKGWTMTDVNGRWIWDIYLNPATYTIIFYKPGAYIPSVREVTVQ